GGGWWGRRGEGWGCAERSATTSSGPGRRCGRSGFSKCCSIVPGGGGNPTGGRGLGKRGARLRYAVALVGRAQRLELVEGDAVADEAHGAVGEGEVGAAAVAAAEGAQPVLLPDPGAPSAYFVT